MPGLLSCSGNADRGTSGKTDSTILKRKTDSINKTPSLHASDSTAGDPDTIFSAAAVKIIEAFPECKLAEKYVDSISDTGKMGGLSVNICNYPTEDEPYYTINVGYVIPDGDSEGHFDAFMLFHVYRVGKAKTPLIKYYEIHKDTELGLKTWRAQEEIMRKKGSKYWFF